MLPVLTSAQMREADAYTIAHEPVASIDLMERAARACADRILGLPIAGTARIMAVCGPGNNGGDGLAIARMLAKAGRRVEVLLVTGGGRTSPDNMAQQQRAAEAGLIIGRPASSKDLPASEGYGLVIDALFGSGSDRPLQGLPAEVVGWMNASGAEIVPIDMPSGVLPGSVVERSTIAVRAALTLKLECPELSLLLPENAGCVGSWEVVPIGLDKEFVRSLVADHALIEAADIAPLLPPRRRSAHKGDHGHALLMAGSAGMIGAAVLAVRACVRSGVGLCTAHVPGSAVNVVLTSVPEAMCTADPDARSLTELPDLSRATAIGMGPGIGRDERTATVLKLLIQEARVPLVLDADALNILSENRTWMGFLPRDTILTPHPGEFDRLSGPGGNSAERLERARAFAVKHGVIVILKGAFTAIVSSQGGVFFNPTGNPGMAKGGSGDVLTGVLTALCAQGMAPLHAAMLGTYAHGAAGDIAAAAHGMDGIIAGDIVAGLPQAFRSLRTLDQSSPSTDPRP